jgi:hypothetical protein
MPGWMLASRQKRPPVPSMRSRKAENRNSQRPGSQAPHAPPALTFGLPGKQSVKMVEVRAVLMCPMNALRRYCRILATKSCWVPERENPGRYYFPAYFLANSI